MRCFGEFHTYDDRTCDACRYIISCKKESNKRIESKNKLNQIQNECIHAVDTFKEYNEYVGCNKENRVELHYPECQPSEECGGKSKCHLKLTPLPLKGENKY